MSTPAMAAEVTVSEAVPNLVAVRPSFTSNLNPLNTPQSTGLITVAQSPLGTPTPNTGRTESATQAYLTSTLDPGWGFLTQATSGVVSGNTATTSHLYGGDSILSGVIIVAVAWRSNSQSIIVTSVTDQYGSSYQDCGAKLVRFGSNNTGGIQCFYSIVPSNVLLFNSTTVNLSGNATNLIVTAVEYANFLVCRIGPISTATGNTGQVKQENVSTGNIKTVGNNDLIFGVAGVENGTLSPGSTKPNSTSSTFTPSVGGAYFEGANIVGIGNSVQASWIDSASNDYYGAIVVDFSLR